MPQKNEGKDIKNLMTFAKEFNPLVTFDCQSVSADANSQVSSHYEYSWHNRQGSAGSGAAL